MRLTYSKTMELFEQENVPDLVGFIDHLNLLTMNLLKKGDYEKVFKILNACSSYDVLESRIPYYNLLTACNLDNTVRSESAYGELVKYFIRNNDPRIYELLLDHINVALFKYSDFENAKKYIKIVLDNNKKDYTALKYWVYCHTNCNDKNAFYLNVPKLQDLSKVKAILKLNDSYEAKYDSVEFIILACYKTITHYKNIIDYMNVIDIVQGIVSFFPSEYVQRFEILCILANKLREARLFDEAIKIYQYLIRNEYKVSICYWMILLCKRHCVNDHELVKSAKRFDNMIEYRFAVEEALKEGNDPSSYKQVLEDTLNRKRSTATYLTVFFICLAVFVAFIVLAVKLS